MVEDTKLMCERLRGMELATCNEAADLIKRQAEDIAESDAIIDELRDHLTALESERDALLAAAGKEAVAIYQVQTGDAWLDMTREQYERHSKTRPTRIVYTAPTAAQCTVPDGWKLVPVKPTPEMEDAAYEDAYRGIGEWARSEGAEPRKDWTYTDAYAAMVAAAPTAAHEKGDGRDAERWRACVAMKCFPEYCGHDDAARNGASWYMPSEWAPEPFATPEEAIDAALSQKAGEQQ